MLLLTGLLSFIWFLGFFPTAHAGGGALLLIGGGDEDFTPGSWCEAPYKRLIELSGGGNLLIVSPVDESCFPGAPLERCIPIGTSVPGTGRTATYFRELGARSVEYLTIGAKFEADSDAVVTRVSAADAIFLTDRPVSVLLHSWKGSRFAMLLKSMHENGKPLAAKGESARWLCDICERPEPSIGTQAGAGNGPGMEPLVGAGYASAGLLLRNAMAGQGFSETDGLGLLSDTFFQPRASRDGGVARMGVLLGRFYATSTGTNSTLLGLGLDEKTTLFVDANGFGMVGGEGSAVFLTRTASSVFSIRNGLPPIVTHLACDILTEGFLYNLTEHHIAAVPEDTESVFPTPPVRPYESLLLDGTSSETARAGLVEIVNHDEDALALQGGRLGQVAGHDRFNGTILVNRAFENRDLVENRVGGLLWAMANHPYSSGVLIDHGGRAELFPDGLFTPLAVTDQPTILLFDARNLAYRAFGTRKGTADGSGPRQTVALAGLSFHLIATRCTWNARTGGITVRP
ncbi:MAG: hypothetical protein WA705_06400 [Candidatus Ozemobacteraceae bacterium]